MQTRYVASVCISIKLNDLCSFLLQMSPIFYTSTLTSSTCVSGLSSANNETTQHKPPHPTSLSYHLLLPKNRVAPVYQNALVIDPLFRATTTATSVVICRRIAKLKQLRWADRKQNFNHTEAERSQTGRR